ncbi:hypothetical protein CLV80_1051 [Yoonia maritima]|uniref:Uncharacterized protein n=1 Tax=Yoonia maritima TaxID=1435347 RepID=A0A2T0VYW8_9RHOB|nr:hypothetical protein CLV80_1051 [Yoonia maritima]
MTRYGVAVVGLVHGGHFRFAPKSGRVPRLSLMSADFAPNHAERFTFGGELRRFLQRTCRETGDDSGLC